jgi:hypothetical protein
MTEKPSAPRPVSVVEIVEARKRQALAILNSLSEPGTRLDRSEENSWYYWQGCLDLAELLLPILEQHEAQAKAMREKLREAEINNP